MASYLIKIFSFVCVVSGLWATEALNQEIVTVEPLKTSSIELQKGAFNTIFEGKNVSAKHLYFGGDVVFISFNAYQSGANDSFLGTSDIRCRFGLPFFQKRKIDSFYIGNHYNNWYQTEEMIPLIALINDLIKQHNYKEIITYGGSMGGWAAIAFSKILNANKVIAFCPQIVLEINGTYNNLKKILLFNDLYNVEEGINIHSIFYVFYSKNCAKDKKYCEEDLRTICLKKGDMNLNLYSAPHDEHTVMRPISNANLLGPILLMIMDNNLADLKKTFEVGSVTWLKMKDESEKLTCCKVDAISLQK